MVKTELEYNPYLMEINVKFNGREPRVNSLIEKYKKSVLQDWMKELPEIFYNEMNGYDFELEFTGTVKDYEDLRNIFISNGVDDNLVHIIHKNELDARNEKMKQIRELIEWISNNDNKRFSFEKFSIKNDELLDGVYNFIIIQGRNVDTSYFSDKNMSFEYIEDITKLDDTELSNTPILICINNDSVSDLQKNIDYIMKRVEIKEKQIFFSIDTELIEKEIVRIIKDMGIEYPQLISSLDDEKILSYIWIYPITDYIKQFIKMAKYDFVKIRDEVETEKTAREESNKVIYEQLDKIEALIVCMKDVCDKIINRDNLNISDEWLKAKEHVCISLDRWKEKKTKITKESDAIALSKEFNDLMKSLFDDFVKSLEDYFTIDCEKISQLFYDWYKMIDYDEDFVPDIDADHEIIIPYIKNIQQDLLSIKEEEYVIPKDAIFGKLFGSQSVEKEPVLEISYYYMKWREFAKRLLIPIIDNLIEKYAESLQNYYDRLADAYLENLREAIKEQETSKEKISCQLSEEDKRLEEDLDWCNKVIEQLRIIERG